MLSTLPIIVTSVLLVDIENAHFSSISFIFLLYAKYQTMKKLGNKIKLGKPSSVHIHMLWQLFPLGASKCQVWRNMPSFIFHS